MLVYKTDVFQSLVKHLLYNLSGIPTLNTHSQQYVQACMH